RLSNAASVSENFSNPFFMVSTSHWLIEASKQGNESAGSSNPSVRPELHPKSFFEFDEDGTDIGDIKAARVLKLVKSAVLGSRAPLFGTQSPVALRMPYQEPWCSGTRAISGREATSSRAETKKIPACTTPGLLEVARIAVAIVTMAMVPICIDMDRSAARVEDR